MKTLYRFFNLLLTLFVFLLPSIVFGQNNDVEMADTFRQEGKIYVVIAVIAVILAGLITFLILIDRKVSKIEKGLKEKDTATVK